MSKATPVRKKSRLRVTGSFAILLGLLVAPACAPLCAARMCSQTAAPVSSEERCHSASVMHGDVPQIHAAVNCNAPELAASALSAGNKSDILKIYRETSRVASHAATAQKFDSSFIAHGNNFSVNQEPSRASNSFPATSVLRI